MTNLEAHRRYNASEKGKARYRRYRAGHAAAQARYRRTLAGRLQDRATRRLRQNEADRAKVQELEDLLTEGS